MVIAAAADGWLARPPLPAQLCKVALFCRKTKGDGEETCAQAAVVLCLFPLADTESELGGPAGPAMRTPPPAGGAEVAPGGADKRAPSLAGTPTPMRTRVRPARARCTNAFYFHHT